MKYPIPRKGTETRRNSQWTLQGIYKTIYTPQGDENFTESDIVILMPETLYPRKGTETPPHNTNSAAGG